MWPVPSSVRLGGCELSKPGVSSRILPVRRPGNAELVRLGMPRLLGTHGARGERPRVARSSGLGWLVLRGSGLADAGQHGADFSVNTVLTGVLGLKMHLLA